MRIRLLALSGISVVALGALGIAAWRADGQSRASMAHVKDAGQLLAVQLDADMMHDALRGDALRLLSTTDPATIQSTRSDIDAHTARIEADISEIAAAQLTPEIDTYLSDLRPALLDYVKDSRELATLATSDREALTAAMPAFQQSFTTLEGKMAGLSDLMAAHSDAVDVELNETLDGSAWLMRGICGVGLLALIISTITITRSIVDPMRSAMTGLDALARRDCTYRMRPEGPTEMVQMAHALNHSVEGIGGAIGTIATGAQSLASSASSLTGISEALGTDAESTSAQVQAASAAAEEVSENVQTVATGIEEMSVAMREVAKSASEASSVATMAVQAADVTNRTVSRLGDSSAEIGKVVKVITSIAQQTNLLALNATIEAARAGEAGKGFAVVANEVKELAKETAKATEDISKKVEAIQADTRVAVEAIQQIGATINQIHDLQSTIASAVEEQTATANEIARNVAEAARGSAHIASSIGSVSHAAARTTASAATARAAAAELVALASNLQNVVSQFRI